MTDNCTWIRQTIRHRETGAVPYNFMFSPPARAAAERHYGRDLEDAIGMPLRVTSPKSVKPLYADPREFGATAVDEFGVVWSTNPIDRGTPVTPPLTGPTFDGYAFPDAREGYRFEELAPWCASQRGNFRVVFVGDLWERATFMRGMEGLLLDVALNRSFVEELLERIKDYLIETMRVLFERFEFEAIAVSDDYGTQRAMIISPDDWRGLIKPRLAEIYGLAKETDRVVFHHSCGHILPIVGDMIDIGLDILHPVQPEAMDIAHLKRQFGAHLTFCGGLSTQDVLVNAAPRQVREEVRRLKAEMGRGGGYILEPGITIQADVPVENMFAMIDEARER